MNNQDLQEVVEEFETVYYNDRLNDYYLNHGIHGEVFKFGNVVVKFSRPDYDDPKRTKRLGIKAVNEFSIVCDLIALGYDVPEMYLLKSYGDRVALFMEKIDGRKNRHFGYKILIDQIKEDGFIPIDFQCIRERGTERLLLMDFALWWYKDE
ncbi:MAG: hypothetical protein ABIF40_00820 [archaeon]